MKENKNNFILKEKNRVQFELSKQANDDTDTYFNLIKNIVQETYRTLKKKPQYSQRNKGVKKYKRVSSE